MSAHTPGEWVLIPQNGAGPMIATVTMTDNQIAPRKVRLIAHVLERRDSIEEDEANAKVLAAASDLLLACQMQHDALDILMARLIELDNRFLPTQSGAWPAVMAGAGALRKAGVK